MTHTDSVLEVVCFPFAGAGASFFRSWQPHMPPAVHLHAVELPGRGVRVRQAPHRRMADLVTDIASELSHRARRPFVLYGHSMGALIAFEVARWLRQHGHTLPHYLFVSGRPAPHIVRGRRDTHTLPDEELVAYLRGLNDKSLEHLDYPHVRAAYLPVVRADFEAVHTYEYLVGPPLACSIQVYGGLDDPSAPVDGLNEWRGHTTGKCSVTLFPGGHSFLGDASGAFLKCFRAHLADTVTAIGVPALH